MATLKFVLRDTAKKDGSHSIRLRITKNGKFGFIGLEYSVKNPEKNWDETSGLAKAGMPNSSNLNRILTNKRNEIEDGIMFLEQQEPKISVAEIIAKLEQKECKVDFMEMMEKYVEKFKVDNRGTYETYVSRFHNVQRFTNHHKLEINAITPAWLKKLELWLLAEGKAQKTAGVHLAFVRTIILQAIEEKLISRKDNPFLDYKISMGKRKQRIPLVPEEVELIRGAQVSQEIDWWMHHARNYFLFAYSNAGMRISDVITLKWSEVRNGIYHMQKVDKEMVLPMPPEAVKLIKQYRSREATSEYVFPFMDKINDQSMPEIRKIKYVTKMVNRALERLSSKLGITKNVTSHIARHSFSYKTKVEGLSTQQLSMLLGHAELRTTEVYSSTIVNPQLVKDLVRKTMAA